MKNLATLFAVIALAAIGARADSYTYSASITNTQPITYSDPLPISGYIDRVEIFQGASSTTTVTLATYNGTSAITTFASKSGMTNQAEVITPRFIGTGSTGTALAGVTTTNGTSTTVLYAPYERAMAGGNLKVALTGTANTNTAVTVTIFYDPSRR